GASAALTATSGQKLTINVTASAASGGPDTDKFIFVCKKNKKNKGCGGGGGGTEGCSATSVPDAACPPNAAGGPDEAIFTTLDHGTDLDNGWTGTSHNFPVPANSKLRLCLSGCDAAGTTPCTANGPTGAGSINTDTFGPPAAARCRWRPRLRGQRVHRPGHGHGQHSHRRDERRGRPALAGVH